MYEIWTNFHHSTNILRHLFIRPNAGFSGCKERDDSFPQEAFNALGQQTSKFT